MKQSELQKYLDIRDKKGYSYGGVNHARMHYPLLKKLFDLDESKTILDLGCGIGGFCNWANTTFPQHIIYGVDPVFIKESSTDSLIFKVGDSTNIPVEHVDIITSFDVMEHIHIDDLAISLKEISSKCDMFIAKIATMKSCSTGINGEELHPTVKPLEWWMLELNKYFKYVENQNGLLICNHNKPMDEISTESLIEIPVHEAQNIAKKYNYDNVVILAQNNDFQNNGWITIYNNNRNISKYLREIGKQLINMCIGLYFNIPDIKNKI